MPRPILGTATNREVTRSPALAPKKSHLQGASLQARLRQKRSKQYLEAVTRLDAHTHEHNQRALQALLDAIADEFPDLGIDERPMGIVSRCHLGPPYQVHICDLTGDILEHFETYRSMPPLFERARSLALHPSYTFVEIYATALRAVMADGNVSVVEG